jgi:Plasmid pRiA4b ORF-3-like protein
MMSPTRQNVASDSFNEIATVRIDLRHTDPLIWRQVEVPTSITLKVLHDIVQAVMGWFDYHLWEFAIGKQRYGLPMDDDWGTAPRIEAGKVRLRDVLKPRKTIIDYTYDFGDGWEHRLTVTDVRPGQRVIDELPIKYALARIANRRNATRTRLAKKKQVGSVV